MFLNSTSIIDEGEKNLQKNEGVCHKNVGDIEI